jgi:tyrosinase
MSRLFYRELTRRTFVGTGAASIGAGLLPLQANAQAARFRRFEISDPALPGNVVTSYKKAVTAMLQLPPSDPRNWYRNALVHVLDCPHRNWWFLVWHRAYTGWFERICRELSGDSSFALPYWDWTKHPRVPAQMFEDVLDPHNSLFIATFDKFKQDFDPAVTAFYGSLSASQKDALSQRGLSSSQDLWTAAQPSFVDRANSRDLTAASPDLDNFTKTTVAIAVIRQALKVARFAGPETGPASPGFASSKASQHSGSTREGILESQPHDNVHGSIGGLMGRFLSSADPIFFLHHANLDRLWDVWTRRQKALGRPTLPEGADLTAWSNEQFLFFSGEKGHPVTKTAASEYSSMTVFDYDYAPGSGEDQVPAAPVAAAAPALPAPQSFAAALTASSLQGNASASATASVPAAALQAASAEAPPAVAEVSLNLTEADEGRRFRVVVTPGAGAAAVDAGVITIFGQHHTGTSTFTVPLPENLTQASPAAAAGNVSLNINVVPIEQPRRQTTSAAPAHAPNAQMAAPAGPTVSAIQVSTP